MPYTDDDVPRDTHPCGNLPGHCPNRSFDIPQLPERQRSSPGDTRLDSRCFDLLTKAATSRAIAMITHATGGRATNGAAGFGRAGPAAAARYTTSESTLMINIITYSADRVAEDQLADTLCSANRITNGDITHIAMSTITTGCAALLPLRVPT